MVFVPKWEIANMNQFIMKINSPAWRQKATGILMALALILCPVNPVKAFEVSPVIILPSQTSTNVGFVIPDRPKAVRTYNVEMTAYTSSVEECDDTPFITADGSHTRDGIIAANFLPFNTKVRIPELFGDKIFEVHDRMNARFPFRVDVWMSVKDDMWQFGLHRNVRIEVVEMGNGKKHWNDQKLATNQKES